jgi:spectinomycin phosphotransferase
MIEKPEISDEKIIACLKEYYSIEISRIEFLPLGNDASAFAYRVETVNDIYFLKIRTELPNLAGLSVPRFLKDHGIEQVVAPFFTKTQKLYAELDGFALILYPFVAGNEAMKVGMSDAQWIEFGSALKQIHHIKLPSDVSQFVRQESFIPKWSTLAREFHEQVDTRQYDDPYQRELATFWNSNRKTIETVIERADTIGKHLRQMDLEFMLCHADIHTANILITDDQNMFIVDWDDTLFAPKERDLMHVLDADSIRTREEQLFFHGYGDVGINQLALVYYRYEWCVQEIGDFGQRVFLTADIGERTKQEAVAGFMELFSQGNVIEAAFRTSFESEIRNNP